MMTLSVHENVLVEPTLLFCTRDERPATNFLGAQATCCDFLICGGPSYSVAIAKLFQTEAIAFSAFQVAHGRSSP
jgi:hypothetical protein